MCPVSLTKLLQQAFQEDILFWELKHYTIKLIVHKQLNLIADHKKNKILIWLRSCHGSIVQSSRQCTGNPV